MQTHSAPHACLSCAPPPPCSSSSTAPEDAVFADGTVAFVIGKTFIPPPHATRPIAINSIQIAPIPGNPSDTASYHSHIPHYPVPTIIAQGSVAPATATDHSAILSFALAISDYVPGSKNTSTILSVSPNRPQTVNTLTVFHSLLPLRFACYDALLLPHCNREICCCRKYFPVRAAHRSMSTPCTFGPMVDNTPKQIGLRRFTT